MFKLRKSILFGLTTFMVACSSAPEYQETVFDKAYKLDMQGNYLEASELYKVVINNGHRESDAALHNLGMLYYHGKGVQQNINKGIQLLEQSALRGSALAYTNLGRIYISGKYGLPKNCQLAVPFLLEGAKKGSNIAHSYIQNNFGLSRDDYIITMGNAYGMAMVFGVSPIDMMNRALQAQENITRNMIQKCNQINFNNIL